MLDSMSWTTVLVVAAIVVVFVLLKRSGQVSAKDAAAYVKSGAAVIDVRSPGEFAGGHLPGAVNIPLGEIEGAIERRVKDKNQVILLHCQSGMRSGIAAKKLKAIGYTHAYNLGSYGRAAQILKNK